jgi:glycosyltransferase involved in cell wall biosynthesis
MHTIAVVMPAWNEAEGLPGFIRELNDDLKKWRPSFVVIDDHSTDETARVTKELIKSGIDLSLFVNQVNSGHGPSTLKALKAGLNLGVDFIVAVDGDGQCYGRDLARMVEVLETTQNDVVEGVRVARTDPNYRKFITFMVRTLVSVKSRKIALDANTPFRAYRSANLSDIVGAIPDDIKIPNLLISTICRKWGFKISEIQIESIPRRGSNPNGSTWGKTVRAIPSRRFIKFCISSGFQWVSYSVPPESKSRN